MNYWLLKTEPSVFSFEDLLKAPGRKTSWEGVRNYQARNFLRDKFKKGDKALIYHSSTAEPAVIGVAEVVREAYPDPNALDRKSDYYDEAAVKRGENPWVMIDIQAVEKLKRPITRAMLQSEAACKEMVVLKRGSRLSVQPVTQKEFQAIVALGNS